MIYLSACSRCSGTVRLERLGCEQWLECLACGWRIDREIPRPARVPVRVAFDDGEQGRLWPRRAVG